jgi:hypothetical protein
LEKTNNFGFGFEKKRMFKERLWEKNLGFERWNYKELDKIEMIHE